MTDLREPFVSVILPCLDEAESISACVSEARRGLDRADLRGEVLVIDNGSVGGSADLDLAMIEVVDIGNSARRPGPDHAWIDVAKRRQLGHGLVQAHELDDGGRGPAAARGRLLQRVAHDERDARRELEIRPVEAAQSTPRE